MNLNKAYVGIRKFIANLATTTSTTTSTTTTTTSTTTTTKSTEEPATLPDECEYPYLKDPETGECTRCYSIRPFKDQCQGIIIKIAQNFYFNFIFRIEGKRKSDITDELFIIESCSAASSLIDKNDCLILIIYQIAKKSCKYSMTENPD